MLACLASSRAVCRIYWWNSSNSSDASHVDEWTSRITIHVIDGRSRWFPRHTGHGSRSKTHCMTIHYQVKFALRRSRRHTVTKSFDRFDGSPKLTDRSLLRVASYLTYFLYAKLLLIYVAGLSFVYLWRIHGLVVVISWKWRKCDFCFYFQGLLRLLVTMSRRYRSRINGQLFWEV